VLLGLALFLTFFIMSPVLDSVYSEAYQPLSENKITYLQAIERGAVPLRKFMLKQTRETDIALFARMANAPPLPVCRRHSDASAGPGLRHQRAENGVPDRLHHLHSPS
jgi:flagellar biosynthesis protein FliP